MEAKSSSERTICNGSRRLFTTPGVRTGLMNREIMATLAA